MPELTLLPCPACKNTNVVLRTYTRAYGFCPACGMCGPCAPKVDVEYAVRQWNALPRALTWTDEPPKVPGWYSFKDEYGIRIAWIKHDSRKMNELYAVIGGIGNWMSTLHGQWAGPIPEPRETKKWIAIKNAEEPCPKN